MSNTEVLRQTFAEALHINENAVVEGLTFNSIREWDSVAHMTLVAAIEEKFDIMLDTDDILAMSSFAVAINLLKKYNVEF